MRFYRSAFSSFLFINVLFSVATAQSVSITIDPLVTYQTIDGFAASDCWSSNYVGKYWDDTEKERLAELLFSQKKKTDGSPEGIGLSMWRMNLGAGTAEQGNASDISEISRRAECFLDETGTIYDWTKQAGQQYFLHKAKEYGCNNFVAFSNSPLVFYTRNGLGHANGDGYANLQADKYDDYAEYLATVIKHFKDEKGINFQYISPVNEPQYPWEGNKQEGSPWYNHEIAKLTREIDKSLQIRSLDTKILLAEAANWKFLYTLDDRPAGGQINTFFTKSSSNYIGDLPSMAPVIGGHSYGSHDTDANIVNNRTSLKYLANLYKLKLYQTEWCSLSNIAGLDYANASYMDIALYMAKVIHSDLYYANVSSWSYWTAMDIMNQSFKNRYTLIDLQPGGGVSGPITMTGNIYDRETLWTLGNYSFFIRPGYKRISMEGATNLNGLMGTAYLSPDNSKLVVVYVNTLNENVKVKHKLEQIANKIPVTNKMYVTNSSYKLRKYGRTSDETYNPDREFTILSRSVTTIEYELDNISSVMNVLEDNLKVYPAAVKKGESINIRFDNLDIPYIQVMLYSLEGRPVHISSHQSTGNRQYQVPIPYHLAAGTYLLRIHTGGYAIYRKLIIN